LSSIQLHWRCSVVNFQLWFFMYMQCFDFIFILVCHYHLSLHFWLSILVNIIRKVNNWLKIPLKYFYYDIYAV
jgi:hypothetical protein